MAKSQPKIALSESRDIPLDKLILSQSNVRRIKAGVAIEELAEDIARRTLLQSLTVRAVCDADGVETGMFEVPAGGRRFRALELLAKQKRLAKNAPIPCIIRTEGIAEEDSLAENVQRAPLHPLDQFRAFLTLREKGQSEEEIAAVFFVSVAVVKQRLRLASVAPALLDVYAADGITLDQLMAFTVNGDHARQEQVFELLGTSHSKEPYVIRRMLTEGAVRVADKRAQFIGLAAYEEAGGVIMRDLFLGDDGGWLQDVGLVDMMVSEKLREEAGVIGSEGWKWVEVALDFPYGHTFGQRQLRGEEVDLTAEEQAARDALQAELDGLEVEYGDGGDLPDEVDQRLGEIETALATFDERPMAFDPAEVARAGAFVSIDGSGQLRVQRGFVRPEDELPIEPEVRADAEPVSQSGEQSTSTLQAGGDNGSSSVQPEPVVEPEEDEGMKPIPDRLMTEMTAHRTLTLRYALGDRPEVAFLAALHAICLQVFYPYTLDTCLELAVRSASFGAQAPGLADSPSATAIATRQQRFASMLPKEAGDLWDVLAASDGDTRQALFAHCVASSVNAVFEAYNRKPKALAHADRLAQAVDLDMVSAGWAPTVDNFLGRVTKARIVAAVGEARGAEPAQSIEHLKKAEMADQAQELLAGSGWLPEPLRTPGRPSLRLVDAAEQDAPPAIEPESEDTAANDGETAVDEGEPSYEDEHVDFEPHAIAAE